MKVCSKCGAQNADDGVFCSKCGNSIATVPAVVVPQVAYEQSQPVETNPGTLWLWLNIVLTVLCCCGNIVSIVGIVFGGIAVSKHNKGLYVDAKSNANISKWLFIVSLILGALGFVVSLFTGIIPIIMAVISSGDFRNIPGFN